MSNSKTNACFSVLKTCKDVRQRFLKVACPRASCNRTRNEINLHRNKAVQEGPKSLFLIVKREENILEACTQGVKLKWSQ